MRSLSMSNKKNSLRSLDGGSNRDFLYKQIANKLRGEEIDSGLYVQESAPLYGHFSHSF